MSTSLLYHAFGVKAYEYERTRYEGGAVIFDLVPSHVHCPKCRSLSVTRKGSRRRLLKTVSIGLHPVFLNAEVPRLLCAHCGVLAEFHPPFADPWRTYTHQLERYVVDLCRITTIKGAASFAGVSWDVAKDIEKRRLHRKYSKYSLKGVRRIAVDEIAVRRGHRYMTLVMDLDTGRILYVHEGKSAASLKPFLERVRKSRRTKLEAIAMDLSAAYAKAVREALPHVPVVFDRFHVVKLINEKLDELRRAHVRDTEQAQRKLVKGVRYLVLMGADTLDEREKKKPGGKTRLQKALALNEPLSKGYYLKEKLRLLWDEPSRAAGESLLDEWIAEADASAIRELKRMAKTIAEHRNGILAYFDLRFTRGPLVGVNNKVKVLKRMG
jgi:transposase